MSSSSCELERDEENGRHIESKHKNVVFPVNKMKCVGKSSEFNDAVTTNFNAVSPAFIQLPAFMYRNSKSREEKTN